MVYGSLQISQEHSSWKGSGGQCTRPHTEILHRWTQKPADISCGGRGGRLWLHLSQRNNWCVLKTGFFSFFLSFFHQVLNNWVSKRNWSEKWNNYTRITIRRWKTKKLIGMLCMYEVGKNRENNQVRGVITAA